MIESGRGSIVNVSSKTAEFASPNYAAYTAYKGAMNALTRSIAVDYARYGIRCNTVEPGYIVHETRPMTAESRDREQARILTRMLTATDVALGALYLASREAEVVTGFTLRIDGGEGIARSAALG